MLAHVAFLLCLASAPSWSHLSPVDDIEFVIVSDGTTDLWNLSIDSRPGRTRHFFKRAPGEETASVLAARAYREDGAVRLELSALTGGDRKHVPAGEEPEVEGMTRVPLGAYIVPASGFLSVDSAAPYGFPVLELRLSRLPSNCPGDINSVRVTPSLQAERFLTTRAGGCDLLLRNTAVKRVYAVNVEFLEENGSVAADEGQIDWDLTGERLLRIPLFRETTPELVAKLGRRRLAVIFCVFEDGTYEGDVEPAKQFFARLAGQASQDARFLSFLERTLTTQVDWPTVRLLFQEEVARLPESDPALEAKVVARLRPGDAGQAQSAFRNGLSDAKREMLKALRAYEKHPPEDRTCTQHWELRREDLRSFVAAAVKALGGWTPEPSAVAGR